MIDKRIKEKLNIIDEMLKRYDETIYSIASTQDVEYYRQWCLDNCDGLALNDEYMEIITLVDCFDFNGLSFYSMCKDNESNIYESNHIYWENENLRNYLFLGEDSISWYTIDINSRKYYILDKPNASLIREFETFQEFLLVALESVL